VRMQEPFLTSLATLEIMNPEVALFLADTSKSRHLRPFFAKECTLSKAAKDLGLPLGTMRYWVSKMEELGLLKLSRTEKRKGSPIKYYRTVADNFIVPLEVFPLASIEELLRLRQEPWLERTRKALARAALNHEGGWQAHFHLEGSVVFYTIEPKQGNLEDAEIFYLWMPFRLKAEQAIMLRAELRDIQVRYMKLSEENQDDTPRHLAYLLAVRE
jgi:DNA-binding transcriptional ArsR family regulator